MKRMLFTFSLLATVAVGSAFVGNAKSSRVPITSGPQFSTVASGQCTNRDIECQATSGEPCTIDPNDSNSTQLYQNSSGSCITFLSKIP